MPTSLLQILNDCLLALLLLFFLRTLRAVWVQVKPPPPMPDVPVARPVTTAPARGAPAKSAGALRLRVVGATAGQVEVFDVGEETTMGRSPGCGVCLPDSTVSQVHARLFRRSGKLWVEDLGSTNGTWVNKVKVGAPVALKRGDRLLVGGTMLEVSK